MFVKIFCAVGIYTRGNVEILWSRYMENTFYVGHILKRIIPSVIKCHMPRRATCVGANLSRNDRKHIAPSEESLELNQS